MRTRCVALALVMLGVPGFAFAQYAPPPGPGQPSQPSQPAQPARPSEVQRPGPVWQGNTAATSRRAGPQLSPEQMMRLPVVLRLAGEDSAVVRRDLVYRNVGDRVLHFDLYLPPGAAGPRGAVIFASAASDARDWEACRSYGRLAAAQGLAGIVYEKRYERSEVLLGISDTEALFDYLREHGAEFGVDPSRLVLWAFSAGGKLLGVGIDPRRQEIRAMIGFYPALDLAAELPLYPDSLRAIAKNKGSPSDILEARPLGSPPMLIVRAGLDSPMLNSGIARFVRIAMEANRPIELINVATGRHGFDLLDDNEESRRAIRRAFAFAIEHVGARGR